MKMYMHNTQRIKCPHLRSIVSAIVRECWILTGQGCVTGPGRGRPHVVHVSAGSVSWIIPTFTPGRCHRPDEILLCRSLSASYFPPLCLLPSPLFHFLLFSSPPLRPSSALFLPPFQSKRTVLLCVCPYLRKRYGKERRVFLVVKACRYAGLVALQMRQNFFLFLLFMRVVLGTSTPDVHAVDVFYFIALY